MRLFALRQSIVRRHIEGRLLQDEELGLPPVMSGPLVVRRACHAPQYHCSMSAWNHLFITRRAHVASQG